MKRTVIAVLLLIAVGLSTGCSGRQAGEPDKATSQQPSSPPESAPAPQAAASTAYDPTYGETKVRCVPKGWDKAYFTFSKKPGEDSLGAMAHLSLSTTDGTTKWTVPLTMSGRHGDNDETVLRYVSSADAITYTDGSAPQQVTFLWYAARLPFVFRMKLDDKLVAVGSCE